MVTHAAGESDPRGPTALVPPGLLQYCEPMEAMDHGATARSSPPTPRKRVLVFHLGNLTRVRRVTRQIGFLADEFDVVGAAYDSPKALPVTDFVELEPAFPASGIRHMESAGRIALRAFSLYRQAYWLDTRLRRWRRQLEELSPIDAIVANDLFGLPLAASLGGGTPVIFDAHEHWASESGFWSAAQRLSMRRAHDWIVDTYVPRLSGMTTVSAGIARDFESRTGVTPAVVTNAPFYHQLEPTPVADPIRLIHFGFADERRRLEDTIEAVRSLDGRFTLDLVLMRFNDYRRRLERLAAESGPGIRVLPPKPAAELISFANDYDIGVFLIPEGNHPQHLYALPNKLFDFIQARLAVAIGPSPEMAAIVEEWGCGVVSKSASPADFAATLGGLTRPDIERMKKNSDRAARTLTAENNRHIFLEVVRTAIDRSAATAAPLASGSHPY